jgi:hypothetical protein
MATHSATKWTGSDVNSMGEGNLCRQAIFMDHASCAVTSPYPEMVQVSDAVGQGRRGAAWLRARCDRWVDHPTSWQTAQSRAASGQRSIRPGGTGFRHPQLVRGISCAHPVGHFMTP